MWFDLIMYDLEDILRYIVYELHLVILLHFVQVIDMFFDLVIYM